MRVENHAQIVRLPRQVPVVEGTGAERGLPFDNGRYIVFAHELNGRGHATGQMIRVASFASPELAKRCRDRINAQNPSFQAQMEEDPRIDPDDAFVIADDMMRRPWEGAVAIQRGPYTVQASYLDRYGRHVGGGLVSFFRDEASAQQCAQTLNAENPAYEAQVLPDKDFKEAA